MADEQTKKRWAVVQLALGNLQTLGAVASLVLLLRLGVCRARITMVVITGLFSLVSIYLFRIRRYGT